ncbi:hypothetical protein A0J61_11891, partial [Choanephora cucurbitarum]
MVLKLNSFHSTSSSFGTTNSSYKRAMVYTILSCELKFTNSLMVVGKFTSATSVIKQMPAWIVHI